MPHPQSPPPRFWLQSFVPSSFFSSFSSFSLFSARPMSRRRLRRSRPNALLLYSLVAWGTLLVSCWTIFVILSPPQSASVPPNPLPHHSVALLRQASTELRTSSTGQRRQVTTVQVPDLSSWRNTHGVVHVVQTRFMQYQPNLLDLGHARLEIFQALTLPSVRAQSSQEFLWLIRTDPALHPTLRTALCHVLRDVPNVILVASNENPEGFRADDAVADVSDDSVWVGHADTVRAYHAAAQTHVLLETRLDADDGLETHVLENLQRQAATALVHAPAVGWRVWCASSHLEYQHYNVWDAGDVRGAIVGIKTSYCVTPGLTWGYAVGVVPHKVESKHDRIHKRVPACTEASAENARVTGCLTRIQNGRHPAAVRARSPTSAGMANLILDATMTQSGNAAATMHKHNLQKLQKSRWKTLQDDLWLTLPLVFGIVPARVWQAREYLEAHMVNIVRDNLAGQCTKGHSCKELSKQALQVLLDMYEADQAEPEPEQL